MLSPQDDRPANENGTEFVQILGTVFDVSGAVIAGATITALSGNGRARKTTRSDNDGHFQLSGLPAAHYRLFVASAGFARQETTVILKPVDTGAMAVPLNIYLTVAAVSTSVTVQGRDDSLIGVAGSATQGTVGAAEIQDRPMLRAGEILETVPGLIITQHAGGGKANQYFLRGFNLDHGTDFAISIDDMPLNLPSHAHGEGYADMNIVIPEFVSRVNFAKGPYYADAGNYSSAGSAHLEYFKTLSQDFIKLEGGMYGFGRMVFGASGRLGPGNLLYGGEAYHDDGPWTHPDNYYKFNGLLTYSQGDDIRGSSVTARGYHGTWHSSDQIPDDAIPLVGDFGSLNSTDGGHSQRYSLQSEWHRRSDRSESRITGYGFYYDLNLFSDFTYFLTDPKLGDQFEQQDRRWVAGVDARHTIFSQWLGHKVENTIGGQIRNDWIHNALFQTENRVRVNKIDSFTGNNLPETTQADQFTDTQAGLYAESKAQWAAKLRSIAAMRADQEYFDVTSLVTSANSGTASKLLPSPKLSLIFGPWWNTEFYLQGGFSFHSNDARGATQTIEPVSADNPYPNTPAQRIPALVPTKGGEFGVRTVQSQHLQSTASLWYLRSASELQQDGDTGSTVASPQPSNRYGVELTNFYTLVQNLTLDLDIADSRALFTTLDSGDAAPKSMGGKRVPEAVGLVVSSGVTLHDYKNLTASMRLRNFGPRDLTSDGIYRSKTTVLFNAELSYRFHENWHVTTEVLNLFNRMDHDIDYAYISRITPTATAAFTNVFHPVEPIQVRFTLGRSF